MVPIFEYSCKDCGKSFEALELPGVEKKEPRCPDCSGTNVKKLISAPFLPSSVGKPANDDHVSCCGSNSSAQGCTPGSCCGQNSDQ